MKICEESVKQAIDDNLAHIKMDEAQKQAILAQCKPAVKVARTCAKPVRRVLAVAAAFAMAFCLGGGVLAAAPQLRQSLSVLGAEAMRQIQPVNQVSESNGIRMEVLAAINDGEVASVFLSLQDQRKNGRVAPATWQYTSEISGMNFTNSKTIHYDEETQTLLLQLTADNSENLDKQKITVTTYAVLGKEHYVENVDTGYTLADIQRAVTAPKVRSELQQYGFSITGPRMKEINEKMTAGEIPVLEPWKEPVTFEQAPWVQLTAAGVVDGALHIQLSPDDELGLVNRPEFDLLDENGEPVECTKLTIGLESVPENDSKRWTSSQVEYVIIPEQETDFAKLHLAVGGIFYDSITKGDWSTTFRLESVQENIKIECHQMNEGVLYESVKISPIAATLRGRENGKGSCVVGEIQVFLKDGTVVESNGSSIQMDENGNIVTHEIFDRVIDLNQIDKVLLNGEQIQ